MRGPSKDTIIDAFKYAFSPSVIGLDFDVKVGEIPTMRTGSYVHMSIEDVKITDIEYEDESGVNMILKGLCKAWVRSHGQTPETKNFSALYNTNTRKGSITFLD